MAEEEYELYALQVMSGQEHKVQKILMVPRENRVTGSDILPEVKEEEGTSHITEDIKEVIVPTEKISEVRDGKRRVYDKKMFAGYVFVRMKPSDELYTHIRNTPGVIDFLTVESGKPVPIKRKEAESMLTEVAKSKDKTKPKQQFEVGQRVVINDGPFSSLEGSVELFNADKGKVTVSISIFGRDTEVELDAAQVNITQ